MFADHGNILPIPGEALFTPGFFSAEESNQYFDQLSVSVLQPRFTALYGDEGISYTYSGMTMHATLWTDLLLEIKTQVEDKCGAKFNTCLLNHYRDGNDSIGWHRDNDKNLGNYPIIASLSFGAHRLFQFRRYVEKIPIISVDLTHGSLLIMKDETQNYWEHRLPKTVKPTQPRINLTFRLINE